MIDNEEGFQYSYSAREQEEIKKIREKYQPETAGEKESKLEQLRKLDAGVTKKATIVSLAIGVISCLVMGTGMSMVLVGNADMLVPGSAVGIVGIVGMILAYPIYMSIVRKERDRIAPEVLRLTEELLKQH